MILKLHVPPLARGQGQYELDRFFVKWESSNYRSNFNVSRFFRIFSQLLLTILYRYHLVPALWLVKAHRVSLNLPYVIG